MVNTINSTKDLNFAGKWLSSTFQAQPILTRKKKRRLLIESLKQDILALQNSTDLKLLEQTKEELSKKTELLDKTIQILGKEDISTLTDLSNLLEGRSLKGLRDYKQSLEQKIKDQDLALLNLARQKIKGQKEAERILNELETKWSKKEIEWEQEKEKAVQQLAKRQETITSLEKEKSDLKEQIKTLSENNDKLQREKETLILSKNQAVEQIKQNHQDDLRRINVLFDSRAVGYDKIDFNGLYKLLEEVSKRERESKNLKPDGKNKKKKNK